MTLATEMRRPEWLAIRESARCLRRELHAWPELGHGEIETTRKIARFLSEHCVSAQPFENSTGLLAFIDNGRTVTAGLRVDIDALPIDERTGVDFASRNEGIMHACGHDMHATIGASVAALLQSLRHRLPVNVKVVFQPAEECSPHGGAKKLIDLGVLRAPALSFMLGFHVWPDYRVGEIGIRPGPVMASSDRFHIVVEGVSSHAAQPHKGVDAIIVASQMLNAIYEGLPRTIDPFRKYVLTIGEISSRGRYNIISDHVELVGTIRTLDGDTRQHIHRWLADTVSRLPAVHGAHGKLRIERGYDSVLNDEELSGAFARHAQTLLGAPAVRTNDPPSFIAEDFSAFSNEVPSVYFHLGCESRHALHSEKFLADEGTLDIGVELLASFFLDAASREAPGATPDPG